jgi:hypothetical protein
MMPLRVAPERVAPERVAPERVAPERVAPERVHKSYFRSLCNVTLLQRLITYEGAQRAVTDDGEPHPHRLDDIDYGRRMAVERDCKVSFF